QATRTSGTWSIADTVALAAGTYTARAEQSDDAGNVGLSSASTFNVDVTPPAVSLDSPASGTLTNSRTPALSGAAGTAAGDASTVTARIYAGPAASGTPIQTLNAGRSGGSWSATPAALADGTYTARAEQIDAAGNTGQSQPRTFTVDATPPQ